MKKSILMLVATFALALAAADADAAKRFGGGGNLGKQRSAPMAREAPKETPAAPTSNAAPAKPAQAAPAPATPAPQPSFMSRWGGLLAGLGIGALLGSLFGAQGGPIAGLILMVLLACAVLYVLWRLFAPRGEQGSVKPMEPQRPVQFAGIGSALPQPAPVAAAPSGGGEFKPAFSSEPAAAKAVPDAEVDAFLRVAKSSFIRLQAANDAKDLDDIRDYTTPEVYAEIAMQLEERGEAPQKTEVVSLDAQLVENAVEDDYALASVRFSGLIREAPGTNPESFDEIWNVRKSLRDRKSVWLIAGIQQAA